MFAVLQIISSLETACTPGYTFFFKFWNSGL